MPGANVAQLQPPVKGLNLRVPAILLDPQEALFLDNVMPRASSGELRGGWVEYATNIPGAVVTLAPFYGNIKEDDRVFACNDAGEVYDVSLEGTSPVLVASTGQVDGVWDYANSQGGDENYLVMVSPNGGYWTYSSGLGFVKRDITGDGAGKRFSGVFNWKNRLWLIEENSAKAYYLDSGAIQGPAHAFDFAPVMNRGGWLSYGCDWTFNAGYDIDDYLVLATTSGEVIVYKGYDPTDISTFNLQGVWYVGDTPEGNKCFTQFGGEMYIMSALGVVPISKLVNGGVANDYQVVSSNIQPALTVAFNTYKAQFGWEMDLIYNQNFLHLKLPQQANGTYKSYIMNVQTGAWGTVSAMPMNCTAQVGDKLFFGTTDGRVCVGFSGDSDGQLLDGTHGKPIIGTYMGGYADFGSPTNLKVFQMARPIFISSQPPKTGVNMIVTYQAALPGITNGYIEDASEGVFDVTSWNQCSWAGSQATYSSWCGLQGMGYYGAIGVSFTGVAGTQYISTNVTYSPGGVM